MWVPNKRLNAPLTQKVIEIYKSQNEEYAREYNDENITMSDIKTAIEHQKSNDDVNR